MADAPFDAYAVTPNRSPRMNVPRKGYVVHGAATTSYAALRSMAFGAKQVSATDLGKDSFSEHIIPEADRPWSMSSAWADSTFRSCECANETSGDWTFSDASVWEVAYMIAYWATIDGFWPHRDGDPKTWTVLGHREVYVIYDVSYPTACPQQFPLDLATRRAQDILNGKTTTDQAGDLTMRYISAPNRGDLDAQGTGGALITQGGAYVYSRATHGDLAPEYAATAAKLFNGVGVSEREWDVTLQDARNRQAAIKAANGTGGIDPGALSEIIGAAVAAQLANVTIEADVNVAEIVKGVNDDLAARLSS